MSETSTERFDVVSIGETMAAFVSHGANRHFRLIPAGAESNLATGIALLGHRARWVSRLGDDPLGRAVAGDIASRGVEVAVVHDPRRPTGVMVQHVTPGGTEGHYYRSESAARDLSTDDLRRIGETRWVHVSGITPALSESAAALVAAVVDREMGDDPRVSFDVNLRVVLWDDLERAADLLLGLARGADVVFIGDDEAERLYSTSDASALAELVLRRDGQELVLKRGARQASVVTSDGEVSAPGFAATVVDLTGAGDAFAAGYLAGHCRQWSTVDRLRLGHLMGARVVGVIDDTPPPFSAVELAAITPEWLATQTAGS